MFPEERRQKIVELVTKNKSVLVRDLSSTFNVTNETIRRDLILLESEGKLKKGHGGAYVDDSVKNDIHVNIRETVYTEEKNIIGRISSKFINDGDAILLDASTTSYHILPYIKDRENLTVITNSLKIAELISPFKNIDLILLGGRFDHVTASFLGSETEEMLSRYYLDKSFISCRGMSMEKGITDGNMDQGIFRRQILKRSQKNILVLDNTKVDKISFYQIDDFDNIDKIVINGSLDEEWYDFLQSKNIDLLEAIEEEEVK